jgi:hypothetical protein
VSLSDRRVSDKLRAKKVPCSPVLKVLFVLKVDAKYVHNGPIAGVDKPKIIANKRRALFTTQFRSIVSCFIIKATDRLLNSLSNGMQQRSKKL